MKNESQNAKDLHIRRQSTYVLVEEYHKKFIDPATGKMIESLQNQRVCPVCQSGEKTHILDKSASSYVKCNDCSMVYLNPSLNPAALIDYYTNLNTGQGDTVNDDSGFYTEIYSMGLDSISKYQSKAGRILDIGCSTGFFLDIAKRNGWETTGIELGLDEAKIAADKGHTLFYDPIEKLDPEQKFDAITMWDVLEHIPDGIEQLNNIKEHLNEKGVLFFQVPNSDALAAKILRGDCRMFDGLEHTNLYNPKTVTLLAEKCGYKIQNIRSVISEIAVMNNYLDYEDSYFGNSRYNKQLLDILDEQFIHDNKIGYKLQVTLEKI